MAVHRIDPGVAGNRAGHYWFRGDNCNYNPSLGNMREYDAVEKYILKGWLPPQPFIDQETRITAFGSCFAQNISDYLNKRQYRLLTKEAENAAENAYVISMGESLVNTYALRQQFEWAWLGMRPSVPLWHGYKAEEFGYDESVRQTTKRIFDETDVFILTLGLSEVWYDEPTRQVFWRAVPESMVDPMRHKFRVTTTEENRDNLWVIYDMIREFRPSAKLICTLSPIPLIATFRAQSCISANAVSKAVLRAAVDELYRKFAADGHLFYWPSYEIVTEAFGLSPYGGRFYADRRHANEELLRYIMVLFESIYCSGSAPETTVLDAYVAARCSTGDLAGKIRTIVHAGDAAEIAQLVCQHLANDDAETAELIVRYAGERHPERDFDYLLNEIHRSAKSRSA